MTKREAVAQMRAMGTHNYYSVEFGQEVLAAFGMTRKPERERANTRNPKGLFVDGVPANTVIEGYSSHRIAEAIASHLGLHGVWEQMTGRGSRERAALDAIEASIEQATNDG